MLIMAIIGALSPTLFYQFFGSVSINLYLPLVILTKFKFQV